MAAPLTDRVERSRIIGASPDVIYAAISDVTRMGDWSDECYWCEWHSGFDGPVIGAVFDGHNRNGDRRWTSRCTVIEAEPGRAFAFECSMFGYHYSTWGYRIEPSGTGSRVTEWSQDLRPESALELSKKISGRPERADRDGSAERNRLSMSWTLDRLAEALERQPLAGDHPDNHRYDGRRPLGTRSQDAWVRLQRETRTCANAPPRPPR